MCGTHMRAYCTRLQSLEAYYPKVVDSQELHRPVKQCDHRHEFRHQSNTPACLPAFFSQRVHRNSYDADARPSGTNLRWDHA